MLGPALRALLSDLQRASDRSTYEDRLYKEITQLNSAVQLIAGNRVTPDPRRWGVWTEYSAPFEKAAAAFGVSDNLPYILARLDRASFVRRGIPEDWHFGVWGDRASDNFGMYVEGDQMIQTQGIAMPTDLWPTYDDTGVPVHDTSLDIHRLSCPNPDCPNKGI